jgi:hypothetical protein
VAAATAKVRTSASASAMALTDSLITSSFSSCLTNRPQPRDERRSDDRRVLASREPQGTLRALIQRNPCLGGIVPTIDREILVVPSGYACQEAASTMAQLDDQTERLVRDLEGITPAELEWQHSPGMNTIGMLLAHNAVVEVFWSQIGLRGEPVDCEPVIGIDVYGDGMPLPANAPPPASLAGKPLSYYLDLLACARSFAKQTAMHVTDAELETMRSRTRRDGSQEEFNVRWVLYHMVEHYAGHYGQILLLRHQYRSAQGGA